jgi:hypothetical protein
MKVKGYCVFEDFSGAQEFFGVGLTEQAAFRNAKTNLGNDYKYHVGGLMSGVCSPEAYAFLKKYAPTSPMDYHGGYWLSIDTSSGEAYVYLVRENDSLNGRETSNPRKSTTRKNKKLKDPVKRMVTSIPNFSLAFDKMI